jgi:trigger factor
MIFSKENVDELNAVISVKISPDDYQPKVDKAMKEYAKKAQIPGFRKGMVPVGMIKKMYGKSLMVDEINKLLGESVHNYIVENKFDLLGHALPRTMSDAIDWDNQKEFIFEYDIAFAPTFNIDFSGETFTRKVVKFSEALIDDNVRNIAKRYGKVTNPLVVEKDDMVYLDFTELDVNGIIKENGIFKNSPIALDTVPNEDTRNLFIGKEIGFTTKLNPVSLITKPEELSYLLGLKSDQIDSISNNFEVKITNISRLSPADLLPEFFEKIYGSSVTTEEQFRDKVSEELKMMFASDSEKMLVNDIQKRLIEKTNLHLPSVFLKRWIKTVNEKPLTDEQIEQDWPAYENSTRWQLIETKLLNENNITITEQEAKEHVEGLIRKQFQQYNMMEIDDAMLQDTVKNVLKNEEERRKLYQSLYDGKLMTLYKTKCAITEQEMDEKDFYKS